MPQIAIIPPPTVHWGPEYLALPRHPTPWLIRSLLPRRGFLLVHAPPKQGKSTALLQMAEALSLDAPSFFGLGIHEHGPVGILQLDTADELWREEYVQQMANGGLNFSRVAFQDTATIPSVLMPFNFRSRIHCDWIKAWVEQIQPVAVVIDSYRRCFIGEERGSDIAAEVIGNIQQAIAPAALILIHHNKKPTGDQTRTDESLVEESRGSTALPAMADVIWRIGRKRWALTGRGGDARIDVVFDPETTLLHPKNPMTDDLVKIVMADSKLGSDRARALRLSELTGLPFETVRTRLKRAKARD